MIDVHASQCNAHLTVHLGAPPLFRPPIPPSVKVQTSLSVTLTSRTALTPCWLNPPPPALHPWAGKCTFLVRVRGEHSAETIPQDVPTQRTSEKGSRVRDVGMGLGSRAVGGRARRWRGL